MFFAFEAMRSDGMLVADLIEAGDRNAAVAGLRDKGLVVLKIDARPDAAARRGLWGHERLGARDLILFTRQMKMLLESGAPVVPALEATEQQTARPAMQALLGRLRERVEQGGSFAAALESERHYFDPVFCSMVAAGEATGSLSDVFGRLATLTHQQRLTRKFVLGALLYPAILSGLLVVVLSILIFFVVPRFRVLFINLNAPLPFVTGLLFAASEFLLARWPYVLSAVVATVIGLVVLLRTRAARLWLDRFVLRVPFVGPLVARMILARIVRVWAAMLRCHVPLLEAIQQSRAAVTNQTFLKLIADVEEAVSSGGRMAQALGAAGLADPIIVSAIRTGEENGRLADAAEFVSSWMDEDNVSTVQQLLRLAEPLLLAVMGVVVGFVAMSLFVPLFDLAGAA